MPPEEFENIRRGYCDDFAIWAWRQLLALGYDARFVVGSAGRYRAGHAWVSFRKDHQVFVVEPLLAQRRKFPRLETLRYRPLVSVEAQGAQIKLFEHSNRTLEPPFRIVVPLVFEWILFRLWVWGRNLLLLLRWPYRALRRRLSARMTWLSRFSA